ncbi:Nuclear transport factor 2 eukaryote [Arabidopsis suecica]|uniref:Nuclear transport factor 2 eukaryote n=1 Tax=Arabidopsis suecica TaxID=45249 RepID=A0A8T2H1H2_ARASU|nr:Nuclear transport factor 2 eukaryote [Arabidopsis suecica]
MVIHSNLYRFFLLISFLFTLANPESDSDLINELVSLRSATESGVIPLNDDDVSKFITSVSTPRPYSLIIFFDAIHLHGNSQLRLPEFRREFGLVSATFIANNNNGTNGTKLFFCEIESTHSVASFQRFAVENLPHISLVSPMTENLTESDQMDGGDFTGLAESMAEFVERLTKLTVGPIQRPPLLSKTQIGIIVAFLIISTPILIKKILKGETLLHNHRIWLVGAVFVYFFSVSGTMHNIIREMPMYVKDYEDSSKFVFFIEESEMQLGAEGFFVGFLYTVVGLLLAFVTNVVVRVKKLDEQRMAMLLSLSISFWAVRKVVYLDNWKTGYEIYPYWPSKTNKGIEEEVASAFVNHYYHLFDNDRSSLSSLYNPTSLLTFEGQKIYGVENISNKLKQLPFDQCRHLISTVDSQPSSIAGGCGGILVFVSGSLQLQGEDHPLRFSQTFHLIPVLQGSFFVQNEMFRLNYG